MTRDNRNGRDEREIRRVRRLHPSLDSGRLAARFKALCVVICWALALQPSFVIPGSSHARTAARTKPAADAKSALPTLAARSLAAVADAVMEGVALLAPTHGSTHHAPSSAGAAFEPEPAAVVIFLDAPSGLSVISTSDSLIRFSWPAVAGAVSYHVERSPNVLSPYAAVGQPVANSFEDSGVCRGDTFLYRVRAVGADGALSSPGPVAMATAVTFHDNALVAGATRVKAVHVNDLRLAVGGVRRAAGLPAAAWGEEISAGVPIKAEHVRELRRKLDEGLSALGLPTPAYEDATLYGAPNGTPIRKVHFEELRARSTRGSGIRGSGLTAYDFASARLDPSNRTGAGGVDPLSRNFNWSLPLVSLPGRAGLDLGLSLTYNSLVWTRSGDHVLFDGDRGWPAPGFRLGFPVVQGKFFDSRAQKSAYLMVTPSGARVSLRQTATPTVFEAGDSSYLQLTENADGSLTVVAPGGTRMSYWPLGGDYKCTQVKDRDGNFITAEYNGYGNLGKITDTLGREVAFGYHPDGYLKEITQVWHREVEAGNTTQTVTETHKWARFEYDDQEVWTNFSGEPGLTVFGPSAGQPFHALKRVTLADDSYFTFGYTTWGQVNKVASYAPNGGLLNYVSLNLPADETTAQADCPRPTERRDWVAHWNGDEDGSPAQDGSEEAATLYGPYDFAGGVAKVTAPDGTLHKQTYETAGWKRGLTVRADEYSADDHENPKKWTLLAWTQDDETKSYQTNPRVRETRIEDPDNNQNAVHKGRRTAVIHTSFGLPQDVKEYDSDAATVLRRTHIEYVPGSVNAGGVYTARRIIGLPVRQEVYGLEAGQEKLLSKVTYEYDLGGTFLAAPSDAPAAVTQHDDANYGVNFLARGAVCRTRRWDADDGDARSKSVAQEVSYNTLGSVVFARDGRGRQTNLSYADSDGGSRFAYPTTVTDPDGFTTSTRYNYDTGAATGRETPRPNVTTDRPGPEVVWFYDAAGRLLKVKSVVNGAYTKWEYGADGLYARQVMKVDTDKDETFVMNVTDGAGRIIGVLSERGEGMGYAAVRAEYDRMGRRAKSYNPIEVSVDIGDPADTLWWTPAGADANPQGRAGWPHASTEYDWKGRVTREVNADGTDRLTEYGGCGCAGGGVVTAMGELVPTNEPPPAPATARRTQRIHQDILGRAVLTEVLKWDGSVYTATTTKYDALDRPLRVRQYDGAAPPIESEGEGNGYQTTLMSYDGHGRLQSHHTPRQDAGRSTVYAYNADDTVLRVTDARGVSTIYEYNNRRLVTSISYDLTNVIPNQNVRATADVTFDYDAAGNRVSMSDGVGAATYAYDALSRLSSETRQFTGLPNTNAYTLTYAYNLAGQLKSVTDSSTVINWQGTQTVYTSDNAGSTTAVDLKTTGSATTTPLASDIEYRAWGAVKSMSYGNSARMSALYDVRMRRIRYELGNVRPGGGQAYGMLGSETRYYADGRVSYAHDLEDDVFDRAYGYDHAGRLKEAYSGREARGLAPPGVPDSPLRQSYTYDAWDNMGRVGRTWTNGFTDAPVYRNDRRDGWGYDADGRDASGGTGNSVTTEAYDAAGRHARHFEDVLVSPLTEDTSAPVVTEQNTIEQTYGGDDLVGRRVETRHRDDWRPVSTFVTAVYYLRSTAMGGRVIAEVDESGRKRKGEVYLGGERLAELEVSGGSGDLSVTWKHADPARGSFAESFAGGSAARRELDPLGQEVGVTNPFVTYGGSYGQMVGGDLLYGEGGNPFDVRHGCGTIDGMPASCSEVRGRMESGSVAAEFLLHDADGFRRIQSPILSFGAGQFGVDVPYLKPNNEWEPGSPTSEVDWRAFAFSFAPQDTPLTNDEIDILRSDIKDLIGDKQCNDFIHAALKELNATGGSRFKTDNILDIFESAVAIGVNWRPIANAGVTGQDGSSKNPVHIDLNPKSTGFVSLQARTHFSVATRAGVVIHELLHFAGKYPAFSHQAMANAVTTAAATLGYKNIIPVPDWSNYQHTPEGAQAYSNALYNSIDGNIWSACYRGITGRRQ